MKLLNVSKVLLISFLLNTHLAFADMEIIPHFKCGEYLVQGKLIFSRSGDFLLRIRDSSSSPFELILLGGDIEKKLSLSNTNVVVKVLVENEIKSNTISYMMSVNMKQKRASHNQKKIIILKTKLK